MLELACGNLLGMETIEDVKTWLQAMGQKGMYGGAGARLRATALEQLTSVLGEDESRDPKSLLDGLDDLARRWATKNRANPSTTNTYRSRAKATLKEYIEFHQDPTKFRPSRQSPSKRVANAERKRSEDEGPRHSVGTFVDSQVMPTLPEGSTPSGMQSFSFTLSAGRRAQLVVPVGLTPGDIKLIKKQIEFLELQAEEEANTK